jgi:hypothetical protein
LTGAGSPWRWSVPNGGGGDWQAREDDRILVEQATSLRYHDAPPLEDHFGIGFYYTNFSNDVPEIILSGDEIGLEIFYTQHGVY